jgi:putative two-component system response regulator
LTNKEKIILVIDDEEMNLKLVEAMLIPQGYKIVLYKSSTLAFQDIESINPDVILLDIMMPVMNGFDFLKKIKRIPKIKNVPVVMVTALNDVKSRVISLELGCDDFISKPIDKIELRSRVKSLIKVKEYYDHIKNHNAVLEEEIRKRTSELAESYRKVVAINKELEANFYNVVFMTFDLISNFDKSLAGHCKRVAEYCSKITDNLNIEQELKKNIKIAALLHDIGLIQIPKKNRMHINEDSNIGEELLEAYKNHPLISLKYFENSPKYSEIIRFIEGHHERLDGTGFPNGKKDKDILLGSKIIAIADYYDTLRYASKKTKDEEVIAQMEKK